MSGAHLKKDDLDREPLLRGRHILLGRVDCHVYWVSNAILAKLSDIPDEVDGGLIVRDKAGNPTGPYLFLSHRPHRLCPLSGALFWDSDLIRRFCR